MIAVTSTVFKDGHAKYFLPSVDIATKDSLTWDVYYNSPNLGMVAAMQRLYELHRQHDIIVFMHDDVHILEPHWQNLIRAAMLDRTAIVGFGGATSIGVDDIYKTPYHISQLQRIDYYSNQVGWEIHGQQETGVRDVAVVDGFLMAVRTEFLKQIGGWKWFPWNFHCYDTCLSLMAHRQGWKVKIVGCSVDHHGGGTSCSAEYLEYCREHGTTPEREHLDPHFWMANEFRDMLPFRACSHPESSEGYPPK